MRLVGYARVSTQGQVERGLSLEDQTERIYSWAEEHNHTLTDVITDSAVSGAKDALDRPGLGRALEMVREAEADGLVFLRLDRLARALHVQEATLSFLWEHGGRAFEVDCGEILQDNPDDPMRTAMRQVTGVFAELERRMIVKRMRQGRERKRERGGLAQGKPPYGFRLDEETDRLVKDRREQDALKLMRRLRRQGESLRGIASALDDAGYAPRSAERWSAMSVKKVLDRGSARRGEDTGR